VAVLTRARQTAAMFFGSSSATWRMVSPARARMQHQVGSGLESSAVAATLLWIGRTFPEAPPILSPVDSPPGQEEVIRRHRLLSLLEHPNEYHTGKLLWMATVIDWACNGDSYWLPITSAAGLPVELWWVPSWQMEIEPDPSGRKLIGAYVYKVDGREFRYQPEQIVHFRYGLDPYNPRRGFSPMRALLREVFTDEEAAVFTASLLRNMGVPGIVLSPDTDQTIGVGDAEANRAYVRTRFTGENRGEPMVMTGRTRVEQFGFSPDQLTLRELRRIPEERVTAVFGIPAMVVGLGAGLERSTFTNMGEAREAAYEAGIIPMQGMLGEEIRWQLLPRFEDPEAIRFAFDLSKVRVLQEDLYRQAQRFDLGVRSGWATVWDAKTAVGLETSDRDKVYLRQANVVEVPADGGAPRPLAPSSSNGKAPSGGGDSRAVALAVVDEMERRELAAPVRRSKS